MARKKHGSSSLILEELEPRLLFSADGAEALAADAAQEQTYEEPVILVEENTAHDTIIIEAPEPAAGTEAAASSDIAADQTTPADEPFAESAENENNTPLSDPIASPMEDADQGTTLDSTQTDNLTDDDTSLVEGGVSATPDARHELILVNDNVRDSEQLVTEITGDDETNIEVIILDTQQDGITQVNEIFADRQDLDAVHVITHGRDGYLAVGNDWLNTADLTDNSESISTWGEALGEDGDILLYGCSIAAGDSGANFIQTLAQVTDADVAASDDPTGHSALGGDWELEYSVGTIETVSPLSADIELTWEQVLAATVGDNFDSVSYDNNDGTVSWNNDWQEIGESDGANDGNVTIYTSSKYGDESVLSIYREDMGVWREANLSGATSATLSFDWAMYKVDSEDTFSLEISTDGGNNWNLIDTISGPLNHSSFQTANYDITAFIDNDTRIKFEASNFDNNDEFFLNNILIDFNASIITVTTTDDKDDGDTDNIGDLIADPGDDGHISLREAITAANNTSGTDRIQFDIDGEGPHTITLDQENGALPFIDETIIIDGTSEPDYVDAPVIQIDGTDLSAQSGNNYDCLRLDTGSGGSIIRGLSITGFNDDGNYGNALDIRTDNNLIVGNYLGIAPDGTTVDGNRIGIILHNGADDNTVGGTANSDKNIISGSLLAGIHIIDSETSGNRIIGNDIGLDATGIQVTSGDIGIELLKDTSGNIIGGDAADEGNRITGHRVGIVVNSDTNPALNNAILGNAIYDNREMAIDLNDDGITVNDSGDSDSGPNDQLNFPVITTIAQNGADLDVSFHLEAPAGDYRIELFDNANGIDGTGLGEGQTFLGAVTITSNGNGFELFNETLTDVTASDLTTVAATATEYFGGTSYGSTSEFGPAATASLTLDAVKDTYINEGSNQDNYGTSTSLLIDKDTGELGKSRILLQFDLSTIPANATITSATLQLNATGNEGFAINVYEVTEQWQEGAGGGDNGTANWDERLPDTPWDTSDDLTHGGVDKNKIVATLDTPTAGLHSWDITTLAQDWYTGDLTNYGLMLASPDGGSGTANYESRETNNRPQLIISYTTDVNTAPSLDTGPTLALDTIVQDSGSPSGKVGTLVANLVDLQGDGGLDNVTDPDGGALDGLALTSTDNNNGTWHFTTDDGSTWDPVGTVNENNALLLAANGQTRLYFEADPGFNGILASAITFRAWDRTSGTNGGTANVTVAGGTTAFSTAQDTAAITVELLGNSLPTTSGITDVTVAEDAADSVIDLFAAFADAEDLDADLTYTIENNTNPTLLDTTAIDGALGTLTLGYASQQNGSTNITLRATDRGGMFVETTFTVAVNPVNDAPIITSSAAVTITENTALATTVTATDSDLPSDTLSFVLNGGPDADLFSIDSSTGALSFMMAPDAESPTDANEDGVYELGVQVHDGKGGVDGQVITVTVTDANEAPLALDDAAITTVGNPIVTASVLTNDDQGDGLTGLTAYDSISAQGGTVTYNNDGTFTYTPAADFTGNDTFNYTITDIGGETSSAAVTVTVNSIATKPTVVVPPPELEPELTESVDTEQSERIAEEPVADQTTPVEEVVDVPDDTTPIVQSVEEEQNIDTDITSIATEETNTAPSVVADKSKQPSAKNDPKAPAPAAGPVESEQNVDPLLSETRHGQDRESSRAPQANQLQSDLSRSQVVKQKIDLSSSPTALLLKKFLDQMTFNSDIEYAAAVEQLREALDEFKQEAETEAHYYKTVVGSAIAVSTGLSVGYVVWLIRGGMLLSSVLFSMPAWQLADPLPLLAHARNEKGEDDEDLEKIIRDGSRSAGKGNKNTAKANSAPTA